jgi:hypothetical protein
MTADPSSRRIGGWALAAASLAILAIGFLVEQSALFAELRFAVQRTAPLMPSTLAVRPAHVASGLPILSISASEEALYDKRTGLLPNRRRYGRDWERPATVSYFERGELQFASGVGLRIHGGGSRLKRGPQSFRLHFRRRYGADQFRPGVLFDATTEPLRHVVVHNDVRPDAHRKRWHFINPLAYDIARRLGCVTVQTKPVRFYLNGEFWGVYVLSEYISPAFFQSHFGHADFTGDAESLDRLSLWVDANRESLTMERVAEQVDVDNMTKWFLSVLFSATGDAYQGPGQFRNGAKSAGAWMFVNWDMDGSFKPSGRREPVPGWERDMFEYLLELRRGRRDTEVRPDLVKALLARDEGYRQYFKQMFAEMLNHRLTPAFLGERFQHYKRIAETYGVRTRELRYLEDLETFLRLRPAHLRRHAENHLRTGPSVRVQVVSPGRPVSVDGFRVGDRYEGWYFPGMRVAVTPAHRGTIAWRVNGQSVATGPDGRLELSADTDLIVERIES